MASEKDFQRRIGSAWFDERSRHDAALVAIPAVLASAAVAGYALPVRAYTVLSVGALLAIAVMADALFRNPPSVS